MDKILKACRGKYDTTPVVPICTAAQNRQHLRNYNLSGEKHGNGYLISEAHFLPNGNLHDIMISFDGEGEERAKMTVAIDNKIISELDIKDTLEGSTELYLNYPQYLSDALVVKFEWDFSDYKYFGFYTKPLPHKTTSGGSSYNNGYNEELHVDYDGYVCQLHVYVSE